MAEPQGGGKQDFESRLKRYYTSIKSPKGKQTGGLFLAVARGKVPRLGRLFGHVLQTVCEVLLTTPPPLHMVYRFPLSDSFQIANCFIPNVSGERGA